MRVKSAARRLAFVQTAGEMFLRDGYAAVSMAAIAASDGSSRVTLYNYFADKEELFEAFVIEAGRRHAEAMAGLSFHPGATARDRLEALGDAYLRLILDDTVIAVQRLIIGESQRFPELARIFYERGPKATLERVSQVLSHEQGQGVLRAGEITTLATHFMALCEGQLKDRLLWGVDHSYDPQKAAIAVEAATEVFLNGYGTGISCPS